MLCRQTHAKKGVQPRGVRSKVGRRRFQLEERHARDARLGMLACLRKPRKLPSGGVAS
jgi:hypothetical protein